MPYFTLSRVITATIMFLQFVLYSSSFIGTLKTEMLEAALDLCQWKLSISHQAFSNSTQNIKIIVLFWTVRQLPAYFCLSFMQTRVEWVLTIFGTQVTKKYVRLGLCFQTIFPFLMTMIKWKKRFHFERFCLWYHWFQQEITFSKLVT